MKLPELQMQLRDKKLSPFYIFTGEEVAVMDIYIEMIGKIKGVKPRRADSVTDIMGSITNKSIFNESNIYVISDDKDFLKQEDVWDKFIKGEMQEDNIVILIFNNIDKRSKFYKNYNKTFTEFEKLSPEVLAGYINRNIGLDTSNAKNLAMLCECNYSRILLESDKIMQLSKANKIDILGAYKIALNENLIHVDAGDIIFDFIDAVCKRNPPKAFKLMEDLKSKGESPLGALSLLYTNFRNMLIVQSAGNAKDMGKRTGLTGWQIKLAKEKGKRYSTGELVRIIRELREIEKGIKTGVIDSKIALDYLLVEVL